MNKSLGILLCIALTALLFRCSEIKDCQLVDETDVAIIALFDSDTTNLADSLDFTGIDIEGFDTPYLDFDTTLTRFAIPLDINDSSITYYFETEIGRDTLILDYVSQYYIYFEECDPATRIFGLEVRFHTFDSVSVVNSELNNEIIRNIEIFVD